jgi:hypothetical protein
MKRVLFVLQNAYRSEKYNFSNDEEWQGALQKSHTGRRLQAMIPADTQAFVINSSLSIGDNPDSCYPADSAYIKNKIERIEPDIICACGKIAEDGLKKIGVEFVALPHPAWRQLSNDTVYAIRSRLESLLGIS